MDFIFNQVHPIVNQHVLLIMVNILITLVLIVNQRDYSNTLIKILVLLMAHYQKVLMNLFQSLVFLIAVIVHVKLALELEAHQINYVHHA